CWENVCSERASTMSDSPLPPGAVPVAAGLTFPKEERDDILEMQKAVYSFTVPIIVDCEDAGEIEVGNGVVIEIGSRTLVASAAHVLHRKPHVIFGPNPPFYFPCKPTAFLRREFLDPPDVGFLEVQKDSHHATCYFESLTDSPPPENTLTMIVGHPIHAPGSLADKKWQTGRQLGLVRASHIGAVRRVEEHRYVYDYPEDLLNVDSDTGLMTESKSYKTPKGFSGGGLWAKRALSVITGVIYSGSRLRLYGLDYEWSREKREAYCVPIRYWVRLVYDHYPDLREV